MWSLLHYTSGHVWFGLLYIFYFFLLCGIALQTLEMLSDLITELMEIRLVQYNLYKCLHLKPVALSQCPCIYAGGNRHAIYIQFCSINWLPLLLNDTEYLLFSVLDVINQFFFWKVNALSWIFAFANHFFSSLLWLLLCTICLLHMLYSDITYNLMYSCFLVRPLASAYFLEDRGKTVPQIFHSFQDPIVSRTLVGSILIYWSKTHRLTTQHESTILSEYYFSMLLLLQKFVDKRKEGERMMYFKNYCTSKAQHSPHQFIRRKVQTCFQYMWDTQEHTHE